MSTESPYMDSREAAAFVKAPSRRSFNEWVLRRGITPDGMRGRVKLYLAETLARVLRNDVRPVKLARRA